MTIDALLRAALGTGGTQGGLNYTQSLALYRRSVGRAEAEEARIARDPVLRRDLAHLERAVATARSSGDLLRNPRTLGLLLEGLGLGDQQANGGLARQALLSDLSKRNALASQLPDQRWKSAAQRLDLAKSGLEKLRSPAVMEALRDGIIQYRLVSEISRQSQAVADAIYIREQVKGASSGIYGVLGDPVLRRVATTVANVPKEIAVQSVEAQARTLGPRFDVKQLETEKGREALIQRYLVKASLNAAGDGPTSPLLQLLA